MKSSVAAAYQITRDDGNKDFPPTSFSNLRIYMLTFFTAITLLAQAQISAPYFDKLGRTEGLPEDYVTTMMQDKVGYLWVCTQKAIVRYDGVQMKQYELIASSGLNIGVQGATSIFQDKKGTIWAGGYHSLYRFNPQADVFEEAIKKDSTNENEFYYTTHLQEDASGNIWFIKRNVEGSVNNIDVQCFNTKTNRFITFYDSVITGKYHAGGANLQGLQIDRLGNIWVIANSGLYKYHSQSATFKKSGNVVPYNYVYATGNWHTASLPDKLWFSQKTDSGLILSMMDSRKNSITAFAKAGSSNNAPVNDTICTVFEDSKKRIWLGTANGLSLYIPNTKSFKNYKAPDELNNRYSNTCFAMEEGPRGGLWILTGRGILYLASPDSTLQRFIPNDLVEGSLPTIALTTIIKDKNNGIWVGTRGFGLLHLNQRRSQFDLVQKNANLNSYPGSTALTIIQVPGSSDYFLGFAEGLFRSDAQFTKFTPVSLPVPNTPVREMVHTKDGKLYIALLGAGIYMYNPINHQFIAINWGSEQVKAMSRNALSKIFLDSKNRLWIGTLGVGLSMYDTETKKYIHFPYKLTLNKTVDRKGALDDASVLDIFEDDKQNIWVGTNLGALNRYDEHKQQFNSSTEFHPSYTCLTSIYKDKQHRIWTGSYLTGIGIFDTTMKTLKNITTKDGLISNIVLSINEDANGFIWATTDIGISIINPKDYSIKNINSKTGLPGNVLKGMYIPNKNRPHQWILTSDKKISVFNPDEILWDTLPPVALIETISYPDLENNNQNTITRALTESTQSTFKYNQNKITFRFTAIHYVYPEYIQFKYKLIGYDKDWIDAGTNRSVTYTNLSPKKYSLHLLAANSDGVWSTVPKTFELEILPPWWKTWWAYMLYALIGTFLLYAFIKFRSQAIVRENKILEQKVAERTGELEQSLQNLKSTQAQLIQSEKMASLGTLTAGIAHEIQNPLNFVNNFSEVSKELIDEIKEELDSGNTDVAIEIANDVKQNLDKISHHGKRAADIVKGMLQHSQPSTGQKQPIDLTALCEEYIRLAYHGMQAKNPSFISKITTVYDPHIALVELIPHDIGKVILNVANNAFFTISQKQKVSGNDYIPTLNISTHKLEKSIQIKIKDNGEGIPKTNISKIFQPFFTTKPSGQGTGLGLSISYDIVKAHNGTLQVDTQIGSYTTFTIALPI